LARIVTDLPFTVAVAVFMRLPLLLAVGVFPPPLPYLPGLYPLALLVGVVPPDPELLVLLPQAAKSMTSVATMRTQYHPWLEPFEMKRLRRIMVSSLASGDNCNENESCNQVMIYYYIPIGVTGIFFTQCVQPYLQRRAMTLVQLTYVVIDRRSCLRLFV
jgi:hypothetical protein